MIQFIPETRKRELSFPFKRILRHFCSILVAFTQLFPGQTRPGRTFPALPGPQLWCCTTHRVKGAKHRRGGKALDAGDAFHPGDGPGGAFCDARGLASPGFSAVGRQPAERRQATERTGRERGQTARNPKGAKRGFAPQRAGPAWT